jgi:hypothetical protein
MKMLRQLTSHRYFVIGNLAENDEEVIRYAGLLRGTESAVQAVSVSQSLYCVPLEPQADIAHSMACRACKSWVKLDAYT